MHPVVGAGQRGILRSLLTQPWVRINEIILGKAFPRALGKK